MFLKSTAIFKGQIYQGKDQTGQLQPWYTSGSYTKQNGNTGLWARFAVAVWQKKDKQADKNIYEYFNCTVYDSQAENLQHFYNGGDFVLIVGEISVDKFNDRNGQPKKAVKVTVAEMGKQPNPFAKHNTVEDGVAQMKQAYQAVQPKAQQSQVQSMPAYDEDFPLDYSALDNPQDGNDIPF